LQGGFGEEVSPCIKRVSPVPKSAYCAPGERPNVLSHYNSMEVEIRLVHPQEITIIDDVITKGATTFACAMRLNEIFPSAIIRAFSMIRTQGLVHDIDEVRDPSTGIITCNRKNWEANRAP
jgi:hypothetical protein